MRKNKLTYLAIPYTWNPNISYDIANEVTAKMMIEKNKIIFSPISHSHSIANVMDENMRCNFDFWLRQDSAILCMCHEMIIIYIGKSGRKLIKESKGCQREIEICNQLEIPIKKYYYDTQRVY